VLPWTRQYEPEHDTEGPLMPGNDTEVGSPEVGSSTATDRPPGGVTILTVPPADRAELTVLQVPFV